MISSFLPRQHPKLVGLERFSGRVHFASPSTDRVDIFAPAAGDIGREFRARPLRAQYAVPRCFKLNLTSIPPLVPVRFKLRLNPDYPTPDQLRREHAANTRYYVMAAAQIGSSLITPRSPSGPGVSGFTVNTPSPPFPVQLLEATEKKGYSDLATIIT